MIASVYLSWLEEELLQKCLKKIIFLKLDLIITFQMKTCDPNPIAFSEILWLVTSFRIREADVVFKRQVVKGLCASVLYVGDASLCASLSYSSI